MALLPVVLQARLDDTEPNPNPLPRRFEFGDVNSKTSIKGNSGWIPLPAFAQESHDVCFVDFVSSPVPMLETYRGATVKSLLMCAVELASGQPATLRAGRTVKVGPLSVPVDELYRVSLNFPASASVDEIEFGDLVDAKLPKGS